MKKVKFCGKILIIGCGSVARCTVPLLLKHLDMPCCNVTVIDFIDNRRFIANALTQGVNYSFAKITQENMGSILSQYIGSGDIIIDLAYHIDTCDIIQWCYGYNICYINTTLQWDLSDINIGKKVTPQKDSLYSQYMRIKSKVDGWKEKGPSIVIGHGANPGLVSHFTKLALRDIAKKIIAEKPEDPRSKLLPGLLESNNFCKIAQLSGTKVIHISERDTQTSNIPKRPDEFVNTWSVQSFYDEIISPIEMGWGTHEKILPINAYIHKEGTRNQIYLDQIGIKTKIHSWVPSGEIVGMGTVHDESITISDYLTVVENDKTVYRPTVYFVYCCCDAASYSIRELEKSNFRLQKKQRIMTDEIISGRDELGVLLMGHDFKSWWCGSLLDIEKTRDIVSGQNATVLQVASSVISALTWVIKNPNNGFCLPEDMPYEEIIEYAKPYLGDFVSYPTNWPTMDRSSELSNGKCNKTQKVKNELQFESFLSK